MGLAGAVLVAASPEGPCVAVGLVAAGPGMRVPRSCLSSSGTLTGIRPSAAVLPSLARCQAAAGTQPRSRSTTAVKDLVAKQYLAGKSGGDQILFVGVAKEKARVWRTSRRQDPVTGKRYPWLYQDQAMANHWYFYGFDAEFGPFFIKFCGYFPYTGQIYFNGHEYAKQQCLKAGIAFTSLDNAFGAVSDPAAVQRICDGLTDQEIYRFAGKWLARLPQPFTRADEDADYRWQLSVHQAGFSTTMALDRPLAGRIFFEQLIRDNLDIGRPDKVNIVFGRTIKQRGRFRTPGTFRTQVITTGTCPYLYLFYKKTQAGQYLKEGRALRTETTVNQPRDLGIGKELTNLAAMAKAGYAAAGASWTPNASATTPPPEPPPWRCSPARSSAPPAPASPACASPTPASRRSWRPAAHSRSGPPASPAATCGTSSPPSWEKTPGT